MPLLVDCRLLFPLRFLRRANSTIGLDSNSIIDRRPNALLAPQVALRRLNRGIRGEALLFEEICELWA